MPHRRSRRHTDPRSQCLAYIYACAPKLSNCTYLCRIASPLYRSPSGTNVGALASADRSKTAPPFSSDPRPLSLSVLHSPVVCMCPIRRSLNPGVPKIVRADAIVPHLRTTTPTSHNKPASHACLHHLRSRRSPLYHVRCRRHCCALGGAEYRQAGGLPGVRKGAPGETPMRRGVLLPRVRPEACRPQRQASGFSHVSLRCLWVLVQALTSVISPQSGRLPSEVKKNHKHLCVVVDFLNSRIF